MAEVVQATGIQKGGLYRHFESREALAYEALDFAVAQIRARFMQALQGCSGACEQLLALLNTHGGSVNDTPFAGGCPIMNTAIESVTATAPDTVTIKTKTPWAPLLSDLACFSNSILPANFGGKTADEFFKAPIGTGPFTLDHWTPGTEIKMLACGSVIGDRMSTAICFDGDRHSLA